VIGIESLDPVGLGDKAGKLTIKGDEVGSLYFLQNEVDVLLEVC